jgi:uncharacterized protein YprB with RNaseH-like and TPR domain
MSDDLRARLRRLRRDESQGSPVAEPAAPAASLSAYERLKRRAGEGTASEGNAPAPTVAPRGELSFGPPARIESSGSTQARITRLPCAHQHGEVPLAAWQQAQAAHLAALARDERIAHCDLHQALFLDTETSGLAGGAGTYVWMVGLGRFVGAGEQFEVWQGFLEHPSREAELLRETAERIAAASMVVTFFGKSFDRHRLQDKMRLHGIEPPFEQVPHLDLYWPLRRAHSGKWADCKLRTLERELCAVQRHGDLPGSFAPAAWFDFLAARPHRLEGVFRHNLDDILSLVALAARA